MELVRSRPSNRVLAILGIAATAALWGMSAPMIKQLIDTFPPCTLAALRLSIAVAVLVPMLALQGRRPRFGRPAILLGLSGVAAAQIIQNFGMERIAAGSAAVVFMAASVVITSLLGWVCLGERCSPIVMLAMLGCGIGVTLVAMAGSGSNVAFPVIGLLLIVGSAAAWSVYAVIGRKFTEGDSTEIMTGALIVGLLATLPFVAYERPKVSAMSVGAGDLVTLLLLGSLVTAGSYLCWSFSIRHLQANEASVLCSFEPAFGLFFAWLLLREGITWPAVIGAAVIVASCVMVAIGDEPKVSEPVVVEPEPQPVSLMVAL